MADPTMNAQQPMPAMPVYWKVSGRKGSSSFEDWKEVLTPVIKGLQQMDWLSGKTIHVVADREFASPKLAEWLKIDYGVDATLRMKAGYVPERGG